MAPCDFLCCDTWMMNDGVLESSSLRDGDLLSVSVMTMYEDVPYCSSVVFQGVFVVP